MLTTNETYYFSTHGINDLEELVDLDELMVICCCAVVQFVVTLFCRIFLVGKTREILAPKSISTRSQSNDHNTFTKLTIFLIIILILKQRGVVIYKKVCSI